MTEPITLGAHLLKRHVNHDPRSRLFPATVGPVRAVSWPLHGTALNQGQTGSCTAQALSQWLNTSPERADELRLRTEANARALYHEETIVQGGPVYPPNDPGGSGVAVCTAAKKLGLIAGYTHAFGIDHAKGAISLSPFIAGTNWYQSMFTPDPNGLVSIDESQISPETGKPVAGGHEYLVYGYDPATDLWSMRNSWGPHWGIHGAFKMTGATFARLLAEQGDVTVPAPLSQAAPAANPAAAANLGETFIGVVTEVHDGDTFRADIDLGVRCSKANLPVGFGLRVEGHRLIANWPVRLASCNAAELATPQGPPAQLALAGLIPVGSTVQLRTRLPGVPEHDNYGRVLADVAPVVAGVAGADVSVTMIAEGFAAPWNGQGPKPVPAAAGPHSIEASPLATAYVSVVPDLSGFGEALGDHAATLQVTSGQPSAADRVVRSVVQVILGECVGIPGAVGGLGFPAAITAKICAVLGLIVLVITIAQNALEAKTGVRLGLHRQ